MKTEGISPVSYFMPVGNNSIYMNELIGEKIKITFKYQINCINCSAKTKKSFHQGYCYSCFLTLPQTDEGVLHPEKDMSHLGISRNIEWAKNHSLIPHYVYLAVTGNIKVGVTRYDQVPYRWIDQGAINAIKLAKTPYRNLAGLIEVELTKHISDKTSWNKMLKTNHSDINLISLKKELINLLPNEFKTFETYDDTVTAISYPFNHNIEKFKLINLETQPEIESKLVGIKGQYLIFENGDIINIRKHNGYLIDLEIL
jgi:hypothetical protein